MYNPSHFKIDDLAPLHDLIQAHPLGCLVTQSDVGLDANHLPFELLQDEDGVLRLIAHVARANPVWQQVRDDSSVLVIFRAEQAYISPSWYPSKHENHEQVPTWNYRVVHAHGRIRVRDDEKFVRGVVSRLTRRHEARNNAEAPWKMSDAPPDYLQRMLGAIVGLEITVDHLEAKFKLSQNKLQRDRLGAVQALEQLGQLDLARNMRLP
ncbi:FMN-binding negative transcriptional regulator [Comamonas sp. C11]|uniref:FMN-binding negative transcriptional regulator n=1 Tax=Comamonas sp. C11 TaxID=2966554 RepID=UPI0021111A75|nr:FMN-binding negative transcriptional regulator [Comamonas sp. C11]UUC92212.1 FMN-binding negative transcriptional regulator [Comamonas sp. C11]